MAGVKPRVLASPERGRRGERGELAEAVVGCKRSDRILRRKTVQDGAKGRKTVQISGGFRFSAKREGAATPRYRERRLSGTLSPYLEEMVRRETHNATWNVAGFWHHVYLRNVVKIFLKGVIRR